MILPEDDAPVRRRPLLIAAAAVTLVLAAVAVGVAVLGGDPAADPAAKAPRKREFVLEVTGSQNLATRLGWGVSNVEDGQHELGDGLHPTVELPWRTTVSVTETEVGVIAVGALAPRGEGVSCRILRDGVVVAEEPSGFSAGCSISVRRAFLD